MLSEVDIFLPVKDGRGRKVSRAFFTTLRNLLTQQFGGATDFAHHHLGEWKFGKILHREEVRIFRVLFPTTKANLAYMRRLNQRLRKELYQEEVLIIRRTVSRL